MEKQKYIEKAKKLLALAKSTNPHEAALAMQRALKLMKEYSISANDVELSAIKTYSSKGAPSDANKPPAYMSRLVSAISRAFGCSAYFSVSQETWRKIVVFYGIAERPQIAAYAFDVLCRQLVKARKEFIKTQNKRIKKSTKVSRADLFCEGWVDGVNRILDRFQLTAHETALMRKYESQLNLSTANIRHAKQCRGGYDAQYRGFQEGLNAELHHGMSGSGYSPLSIEG